MLNNLVLSVIFLAFVFNTFFMSFLKLIWQYSPMLNGEDSSCDLLPLQNFSTCNKDSNHRRYRRTMNPILLMLFEWFLHESFPFYLKEGILLSVVFCFMFLGHTKLIHTVTKSEDFLYAYYLEYKYRRMKQVKWRCLHWFYSKWHWCNASNGSGAIFSL